MMIRSIASPSTATLSPSTSLVQFTVKPHKFLKPKHPISNLIRKPLIISSPSLTETHNNTSTSSSFNFSTQSDKPSSDTDWDFGDIQGNNYEGEDDEECPWEGAVLYKRNAAVSHLEYCTTLERLGLSKLSSEVSRARASEMGIRMVKPLAKDYPNGTPVLISVDVTRRMKKLRLDGIVRTVISLDCNRCGEPAAQSVYSDFSLLLCEEPIQEPETINLGTMFGDGKSRIFGTSVAEDDDGDDDALIDLDDQLYFPIEKKVIDISKNIRDLIHVEITISAICGPDCKGLCLQCGANLNVSKCTCGTSKVEDKCYGPLGGLRKQMQQN